MAPKPDQMQLEKQKTAEILRTQQAAEQTENLQQPLQQNAQTQQNVQQFWTEEMALQEQIPMQSENLSEEMKSAYENAHGQKMGVKSRIWRTERTTKKKRERSNALRAADARYAHNRQILEKKYAVAAQLEGRDEQLQSSVKAWLDLSGTKDGDAANQTMLKNLNGKRDDQKKAIVNIKNKIEDWKLEDYQNLDDRQIIDRYYDIKDKIEKAKAYRGIYDYGISIGKSFSEKHEAKLLAKAEFFIRLEPYIQAKYDLITSPYYSLLRKADLDALSDEQLKQRLEQAAGGNMQNFYRAVKVLRETREDARKLMTESAAFEEEETKKQLQETTRRAEQAKENDKRLDAEDLKREVEEYEQKLEERREEIKNNDPDRFQVLEARRKLQIPAQKALEEYQAFFNHSDNLAKSLSGRISRRARDRSFGATRMPWMTDEQMIQRYEKIDSDDLDVRFAEYNKILDELLNIDFSRFNIASDEDLMDHALENLCILNAYFDMEGLVTMMLEDGLEIPEERLQALYKCFQFMGTLNEFYKGRLLVLSNTEYAALPKEEEPDTFEQANEFSETLKAKWTDQGQAERGRRIGTLMNSMGYELFAVKEKLDRTKPLQQSFDDYQGWTKMPEKWIRAHREQKLAQRKKLIGSVKDEIESKKAFLDHCRERESAYPDAPRWVAEQDHNTDLSEEQAKERLGNLTGEDQQKRQEECDKIFDELLNMDLSKVSLATDAQIAEQAQWWQINGSRWIQTRSLMEWAIHNNVILPIERREAIWKRYRFLTDIANVADGRIQMMTDSAYGEMTQEEEPKTEEEASALAGKSVTLAMGLLKMMSATDKAQIRAEGEAYSSDISRTIPLEEQWKNYVAPPMPEELRR